MFKMLAIFFEPLFRLIAGGAAVYVLYDLMTTIIMPLVSQFANRVTSDSNALSSVSFPLLAQFVDFFALQRHVALLVACMLAGALLKVSTLSMKAFTNILGKAGVGTGAGGR